MQVVIRNNNYTDCRAFDVENCMISMPQPLYNSRFSYATLFAHHTNKVFKD